MQLISLYISGFKSFANETKIQFAPGVTGVVGPNGCGKSNVVDSLRWVLGEQRSSVLRGERMENVIFNGTVKRKPMNLAEVRAKFDNSSGRINLPYGEIEIARRLHRDGTSEYLINGNSCRLRDVTDLLQDSGLGPNAYTILELKMIEDILREEGEGRRQLFEEASGIAKYKLRRRQALSKLEQTNDDLLRLADIITEVERQVASLKRQVSRARRYQELSAELKSAETAFVVIEYYRIVSEIVPMTQALSDANSRAEDNVSYLRRYEAQVEKLRSEQIESDQHLQSLRQALQATVATISALEADKAGTEARLTAARETLERAQRQVILAKDRLATLDARREGLTKDVGESDTELQTARETMQEAVKRFESSQSILKQLETQYRETDARLAGLNKTQSGLETERAKLLEGVARQKGRRDSAMHSREQVVAERAELEAKLAAARSELQLAEHALDNTRASHHAFESQGSGLDAKRIEIEQRSLELDRIEHATQSHINLLKTLEQRGPRASAPIRLLREKIQDVALVADVTVTDKKFSKAIHAALGDLAYHVVVESQQKLSDAVQVLQSGEAGRCGFMIADMQMRFEQPALPPKALGWATDFVERIERDEAIRALLSQCIIAESVEQALGIAGVPARAPSARCHTERRVGRLERSLFCR
ncbi:MAG: AAA family ATPase [bacterium]|nr:AAA family ATPase [bacterium]